MAAGFSRLTVKATHAGDITHSGWFFEDDLGDTVSLGVDTEDAKAHSMVGVDVDG